MTIIEAISMTNDLVNVMIAANVMMHTAISIAVCLFLFKISATTIKMKTPEMLINIIGSSVIALMR